MDNQIIRNDILNQRLQIFEVKQFIELEHYYKAKCCYALKQYKIWKALHKDETDVVQMLYGQLEGIVLRHHAQSAVQAYWIIRNDYKKVMKDYLSDLPTYIH